MNLFRRIESLLSRRGSPVFTVCMILSVQVSVLFLFASHVQAGGRSMDYGRETHMVWTNAPLLAQQDHWYAMCNKPQRTVVLGKHIANTDYVVMHGPVVGEPAARNWVNTYCPSWRCDWNGRCIKNKKPLPRGRWNGSGRGYDGGPSTGGVFGQ